MSKIPGKWTTMFNMIRRRNLILLNGSLRISCAQFLTKDHRILFIAASIPFVAQNEPKGCLSAFPSNSMRLGPPSHKKAFFHACGVVSLHGTTPHVTFGNFSTFHTTKRRLRTNCQTNTFFSSCTSIFVLWINSEDNWIVVLVLHILTEHCINNSESICGQYFAVKETKRQRHSLTTNRTKKENKEKHKEGRYSTLGGVGDTLGRRKIFFARVLGWWGLTPLSSRKGKRKLLRWPRGHKTNLVLPTHSPCTANTTDTRVKQGLPYFLGESVGGMQNEGFLEAVN